MKLKEKHKTTDNYLIEFKQSELLRIVEVFNDYFRSKADEYTVTDYRIIQGTKEVLE